MPNFEGEWQWNSCKDLFIHSICTKIINTACTAGTIIVLPLLIFHSIFVFTKVDMLAQWESYACPSSHINFCVTPAATLGAHWYPAKNLNLAIKSNIFFTDKR